VLVVDALPEISIAVEADPNTVEEPGGAAEFTVRVTNDSVEDIVIIALVDEIHGDLNGVGTCDLGSDGRMLRPDRSYECNFQVAVSGVAGDNVTNMVMVVGADDEGNEAEANDSASVSIVAAPSAVLPLRSLQQKGGASLVGSRNQEMHRTVTQILWRSGRIPPGVASGVLTNLQAPANSGFLVAGQRCVRSGCTMPLWHSLPEGIAANHLVLTKVVGALGEEDTVDGIT
jgi:hypothetical protein